MDFKQRRLAVSALRRVQDLLQQFEDERAFDRRAALVGVITVLLLVAGSLFMLFSNNSLILT